MSEVDIVSQPDATHYGNAFGAMEKILTTEKEGIRTYDATKARSWKISNAEGKTNPVNGKATAYKLMPFTKGSAGPTVLTASSSAVSSKGKFATANLWVTPHNRSERYPAGEYMPQGGKFVCACVGLSCTLRETRKYLIIIRQYNNTSQMGVWDYRSGQRTTDPLKDKM